MGGGVLKREIYLLLFMVNYGKLTPFILAMDKRDLAKHTL